MHLFMFIPLIIAFCMFVLIFTLMFNPKLRGKFMSRQIKATKYMMDESKDYLKDIATDMATATKDGVRITSHAVKEGFTDNSIFCKHCGTMIDDDSKFCKKCGKEQ